MTTLYAVGHNLVGYLPESDVWYARSFDSAKAVLIEDMERACDSYDTVGGEYADLADELSGAEQDLNLANGPEWGTIVGDLSWWINRVEIDDGELAYLVSAELVEDDDEVLP